VHGNPDLGGGDDPTITNRDPDYQEASVPSAPPAAKPGDEISKTMNPDSGQQAGEPGMGPDDDGQDG
jgi:hypothetical protein